MCRPEIWNAGTPEAGESVGGAKVFSASLEGAIGADATHCSSAAWRDGLGNASWQIKQIGISSAQIQPQIHRQPAVEVDRRGASRRCAGRMWLAAVDRLAWRTKLEPEPSRTTQLERIGHISATG